MKARELIEKMISIQEVKYGGFVRQAVEDIASTFGRTVVMDKVGANQRFVIVDPEFKGMPANNVVALNGFFMIVDLSGSGIQVTTQNRKTSWNPKQITVKSDVFPTPDTIEGIQELLLRFVK